MRRLTRSVRITPRFERATPSWPSSVRSRKRAPTWLRFGPREAGPPSEGRSDRGNFEGFDCDVDNFHRLSLHPCPACGPNVSVLCRDHSFIFRANC